MSFQITYDKIQDVGSTVWPRFTKHKIITSKWHFRCTYGIIYLKTGKLENLIGFHFKPQNNVSAP